mgnify:CR=1 FL=1
MEVHKILKASRIAVWIFFNLILVPLIILSYIILPFCRIQFVKVRDDRIGHLAINTELFLTRLELGIIMKKRTIFIGIASTRPCNEQLLKMYKRKLNIVQIPKLLNDVLFSEKSILIKSGFGMHLPMNTFLFIIKRIPEMLFWHGMI